MKRSIKIILLLTIVFSILTFTPSSTAVFAVDGENNKTVLLGGETFGIRMFSSGVLVINVEKTLCGTDVKSPAYISGIKSNDIIIKANNQIINSNEKLSQVISDSCGESIDITLVRNEEKLSVNLTPLKDSNNELKAGMWVKDSAAGIGTITYYDPENNTFGALGHGICESETGVLMPLNYGEIASAGISDIVKSKNGSVGSINGYFEDSIKGRATLNTDIGIFGIMQSLPEDKEEIKVADIKEVHTGRAQIYCTVVGSEPEYYDVEIKKIKRNSESNNMIVEIVDDDLTEITGGIVQGMSGSPIIQDGKLVGALTHVLVNNVKCGYGIFIENMLNASA